MVYSMSRQDKFQQSYYYYNTQMFGGGGCYSTTTTTGGNNKKSKSRKPNLQLKKVIHDNVDDDEPPAEDKTKKKKNGLFYLVRKGDIVGVYKNLPFDDNDSQLPSQVYDLPVSVYKGYNMSKEAEAFLLSRGLKDALYSIKAADLRQDLFGTLVPCPFRHPHVFIGEPEKMFQQLLGSQTGRGCILEFDGACKGNPGLSGAGAVLRTPDEICSVDCVKMQGLWRVRHPNMIKWYEEAKKLKDEFLFFQAKNSAADVQANLAVVLTDGEVQEDDVYTMKTDNNKSQQSMVLLS